MKLDLTILNPEYNTEQTEKSGLYATWYSKNKKYECDIWDGIDQDIIDSPINKSIDRAILDDVQITSRSQVDQLIEFLNNLKPALTH